MRAARPAGSGRHHRLFAGGGIRDHAIAALALSTALAAVPGGAQEPTGALKRIRDAGVLNVGYAESSIPFSYYDRARNVIGYSIDICRTVVDAVKTEIKRPDLKVEMRPIKIDDAASYIASGVIDVHCARSSTRRSSGAASTSE